MWINFLLLGVIIIELLILVIILINKKIIFFIRLLHIFSHSLLVVCFPLSFFIESSILVYLPLLIHFIVNLYIVVLVSKNEDSKSIKLDLIVSILIICAGVVSTIVGWKYIISLYYIQFTIGLLVPRDDLFPNKPKT